MGIVEMRGLRVQWRRWIRNHGLLVLYWRLNFGVYGSEVGRLLEVFLASGYLE